LLHAGNRPALRRMIAVVSLTAATLCLAMSPALAVSGSLDIRRAIVMDGDRQYVRTDFRILDSAPSAHLELSHQFPAGTGNEGGYISVELDQEGGDNASRLLVVNTFGLYKDVTGTNCTAGDFDASCRRGGFDWVKGREYRVVVDRGDHNDDGWLWAVKIIDMETNDVTQLISVRGPFPRLAPTGSYARATLNPNDCSAVNRFAANVQKPEVREGTTVAWGAVTRLNECEGGGSTTAAVDNGTLKLRIFQ
jgi:hypothetical protein